MQQNPPLALAAVAAAMLFTCGSDPTATEPRAEGSRLTLERLYSQPSLIGTAPRNLTWSPDGEQLAFLWNDEGSGFRDVWVVATATPDQPGRWTRLEQPQPEAKDDPYEAAVEAERVERDPGVTDLLWHPDGDRLLFGRQGDLWSVREGGEPAPFLENQRGASFSPQGNLLAFTRQGEIWIADAEGDGARQVTRLSSDATSITSFRWSPAGDRLAVVVADASDVKERLIPDYLTEETQTLAIRRAFLGEPSTQRRLAVVSVRGGTPRFLDVADPEPAMLFDVRWSPDGRALAVDTSDLYAKDRRLYRVDPDGRTPSVLLAQDADDSNETFYFWRAEWSPDGEHVLFLSDRDTDYHVWAVPRDGGDAVAWTSGPWAIADLFPRADGLYVVGNLGKAEERHLFRVTEPGAAPVRITDSAGTHAPVLPRSGSWSAAVHSSDGTPPDLLLASLEGPERTERRVTRSPLDEFDRYTWVQPSYVTFPSHVDGSTLHGRLTLPPDFDPERSYPAILGSVYTDSVRNQWGGRTAHPTWGLDQFLVQEGYVLLNVDMRGSWGRGREHRRGIRLDYGGMDIEDLESGVRFLGTLGYVDLDRVGIWGSSYGGLMTTMSLFRKPGLYAAGIAGAPATNVWHALPAQMTVMMRPEDQPEEYADSSPFLHGHGLEDPLMIIHGMRDRVVLYKDSLVLTQRLLQMDKDVELVTLPNAGHGWDNEGLAQTRFAFRQMVDFFDRHVKGDQ